MNMATKNEIFERYKKEYWGADRKRKGEILDVTVDVIKMHRKAAVRSGEESARASAFFFEKICGYFKSATSK